jgi:8-oxo-dGTP pyrophosphatase MutT (NUDIX family)
MTKVLIPRPAATVLTLRDASDGYEILMLRRNLKSDFIGGAYVFPGGALDDGDAVAPGLVVGLDDEAASARLGLELGGLAYYVACLRELFEEAGLLIVCDEQGTPVRFAGEDVTRMAANRRALNAGRLGFAEMLEREGLLLDLRGLEYLAHWITPVGPPRRYDTRFFVVLAPSDQVAAHDAGETVADRWLRPIDALSACDRGEFQMILPTVRNLQAIAHFERALDVLAYARGLEDIVCVQPQVLPGEGEPVIVTPGDEGFEER